MENNARIEWRLPKLLKAAILKAARKDKRSAGSWLRIAAEEKLKK